MKSDDLIEQAAEAAYLAGMELSGPGVRHDPWINLSTHWKRIYRAQAKAVLDLVKPPEAVAPDPADDYDSDLLGAAVEMAREVLP